MLYVALLRGINIGGRNKIDMKSLKRSFEEVGLENVVTYINSGNIIFTDNHHSIRELNHMLEQVIFDNFDLEIKVVIRNFEEIEKINAAIPAHWTNDKEMKSDILFLWDEVDDEKIIDQLPIKHPIDAVQYIPGAVIWSVSRTNVNKSGLSKIIGTNLYKLVTIRNVNTVRKLYELMQEK